MHGRHTPRDGIDYVLPGLVSALNMEYVCVYLFASVCQRLLLLSDCPHCPAGMLNLSLQAEGTSCRAVSLCLSSHDA